MVDTDDTRRMTNEGQRTTPRVWHRLHKGELKIFIGVGVNIFTYHKQLNYCESDLGNHQHQHHFKDDSLMLTG